MILVPVKNLSNAKQRLAPVLTVKERTALATAMLKDVLDALAACSRRHEVAIVTGDQHARFYARKRSFQVIEDGTDPGETEAIEMATRVCLDRGARYTLVIPGDVPLLQPAEVDAIFGAAPPQGTVLAPSASGRGTNAAWRCPPDLFPLRFGNDSFLPHLESARATGKPVKVLQLPALALDVDEPTDLMLLLAAPGDTRAQRLLRQWKVAERMVSVAHGRSA